MKKLGKLLLMLIMCFSIIGCSGEKSAADVIKALEGIDYELRTASEDGIDILNLAKKEKDNSVTQIYVYLSDSKVDSVAYTSMPENKNDYENFVIGFVYKDKKSKVANSEGAKIEISKDEKKLTEKILKEADLTLEELIKHAPEMYKTLDK